MQESDLNLSDQQLVMLRIVDVATFCNPNSDLDFGRREIIACLAKLAIAGRMILYNGESSTCASFKKYQQRLDAVLNLILDNSDPNIAILLFRLLIGHFHAPFHGTDLTSFEKLRGSPMTIQDHIRGLQGHMTSLTQIVIDSGFQKVIKLS